VWKTNPYYTLPYPTRGTGAAAATTSEAINMFGSLGLPELLVIFAIILVIFGAGKLPQLGKGLGEGISNFRDGLKNRDEKKSLEEKKNA
jgi:sec-independent protein translocase protein TatA